MADIAQLEAALVRAGDAGDEAAARALAGEILRLQQGPSVMDVPRGAREEAKRTPAWMAPIIGAGHQADRWAQGAKQPFVSGTPAGKKQAAEVAGADDAYAALKAEYPWLTTGGEIAATMVAKTPLAMALLGGLEYGSPGDRALNAAAGYAGGKAGELVGSGLARLKGPASMAPKPSLGEGAADFFADSTGINKWGIPLSVAQRTQSKPVQIAESVLANMPTSAGVVAKGRDATFSGFNRAAGETFGAQGATRLTPEVLGASQKRIGKTIGDIAERSRIKFDPELFTALETAKGRVAGELVGDERGLVLKQIQEIYNAVDPTTGEIPGTLYKAIQSKMGRIGQERGGAVSGLMHDTRAALRDAMTRSVSPADSKAWLAANNQYFNVQQVGKAAKASPEGMLSPDKLLTQVNAAQTQAKFGGGNDLAELAQWAKQTLPSGTAQRLLYQRLFENPANALATTAAIGGAGYGASQYADDVPGAAYAGLAIPYVAARGLAGRPASALARALLARGGAATGAVIAPNALAAMLRQRGEGEEQ